MRQKIKVLTFGWEFPPHISGGLGTACYGLTKSLLQQGVDVLFVVPRAHGDEEIDLISASDVSVPYQGTGSRTVTSEVHSASAHMQVIAVPSGVKPYSASGSQHESTLQQWNYIIEERTTATDVAEGRVEQKGLRARYRFSGTYGPNLFQEVAAYASVASMIGDQFAFDIIHAHDWLSFPAGIEAKRASGKPLVIHVHATEFDRAGTHDVDARIIEIEKEGMEQADKIVAVSEWTKRLLVSKYGVRGDKVVVVYNGVSGRKPVVSRKPARLGRNMVTFMGRVTYQKGPQYFVEAARRVIEKFPDTHFVVAGSGDLLPAIMERVAALRLSSKFHFAGFLRGQQLDQVWSVTDVYVMPSVSEPFGITPLEAIRSGVPVIISNQSGVSEVISHAIKTDFWDTDALAGAICSVLRHKSLRNTLRTNSKEGLKNITWRDAARKLNKLYHELYAQSN